MHTLPDSLLNTLVQECFSESTIAIGLSGSFARGDAHRYSDVDLIHFVSAVPEQPWERYTLRYAADRLVSTSTTSIENMRADMGIPQEAIWAVPGLRQMRILHDPQGELARLKAEAAAFIWEPLRARAEFYAAEALMGCAEEAHKIMGGLLTGNISAVEYGTLSLYLGLARALLVRDGVLIPTENDYYRLAQEVAGPTSSWTRWFRRCAGLDPADSPARGQAALRLFRVTAALLDDHLNDRQRAVVETALRLIAESGLLEDGA